MGVYSRGSKSSKWPKIIRVIAFLGNQNGLLSKVLIFLFSYWNLIWAYYLQTEVKVGGPLQIHLGAQKAQNELKRCKRIKILILSSVEAVQFQERAEFYA